MSNINLYDILDEKSLTHHIENIPMGVIVCNKNLEVIYWSQKAAEIFEWTASETLFKNYTQFHLVFEEDAVKVAQTISKIISGQESANQCSNRNYTKSGKVIYCDWYNSALINADGEVTSVLCFIHDVSKNNKWSQVLEESQQQLSLIYNSAIDPMWLIAIEDEDQYRFKHINKSFTEVTGLTPEMVINKRMEEVLPASSHDLVRTKYKEAIQTGKEVDYIEVAVHPAGEKVGEIRVIPVKDEHGQITRIVGIANDITEKQKLQKKLEMERTFLQSKITAAAIKSQEIERSKISQELHDNVNQVLTTVKLYTELCASDAVDHKLFLPKCTNLLNDAINEIRQLSKQLAVPSLTNVSLTEVLKDLVLSIKETQLIDVQLDIPTLACSVIDDDLQLAIYRITQEQLTNILKHARAKTVFVKLECSANTLSLTIADDGVGFDTEQKVNGIGITNMTSRANLLNGVFQIKSAKGEGCILSVSFPVQIRNGKCEMQGCC